MGVPGLLGPVVLLPPPHATKVVASRAKTSKPKASLSRRFFRGISSKRNQATRAPALGMNQRGRLNGLNVDEGAVVATDSSEPAPPGVSVAVLSVQVLKVIDAGSVQVMVTVPVKPAIGLADTVVPPDWPGEVIVKLVGDALRLKSGVDERVIVTAEEVDAA